MKCSKPAVLLSLFFIGFLHATIFQFLEYPENFFTSELPAYLKKTSVVAVSSIAIINAFATPWLAKIYGLKKYLIFGLWAYLIGLVLFTLSNYTQNAFWLVLVILFASGLFAVAFSSVIINLITYVLLEMPKHFGIGVALLFAFMNTGGLISPFLLDWFKSWQNGWILTTGLAAFLLLAIGGIHLFFPEPVYPKKLQIFRKDTLIWQKMHYRFLLFMLAIILYGVCENTFNLWGHLYVQSLFSKATAHHLISLFWLFLILGQLLVLTPMLLFSNFRVFFILVSLILISLFFLPVQKDLNIIRVLFMVAGLGCSACFPILLSLLETEITNLAKDSHSPVVPYLEFSSAYIVGGYLIGISLIGMKIEFSENITALHIVKNFHYTTLACLALLGTVVFLGKTKLKNTIYKF